MMEFVHWSILKAIYDYKEIPCSAQPDHMIHLRKLGYLDANYQLTQSGMAAVQMNRLAQSMPMDPCDDWSNRDMRKLNVG